MKIFRYLLIVLVSTFLSCDSEMDGPDNGGIENGGPDIVEEQSKTIIMLNSADPLFLTTTTDQNE